MTIVQHVASLVFLVAIAAVGLALRSSAVDGQSELRMSGADKKVEAVLHTQGNLHVPSNYRAAYEFLGTWAIAANKGVGSSELHTVYASPGTIAAYCTWGRNARTSRCRGPIVREGGRADNGCSVNWAFVPSMLRPLIGQAHALADEAQTLTREAGLEIKRLGEATERMNTVCTWGRTREPAAAVVRWCGRAGVLTTAVPSTGPLSRLCSLGLGATSDELVAVFGGDTRARVGEATDEESGDVGPP